VRLFVGGDPGRIRGEPVALHGDRCFTAATTRVRQRLDPARVHVLLDSGAFSDPPEQRLSPEAALARQLRWEALASNAWGAPCRAEALVSYDRLIDEVWTTSTGGPGVNGTGGGARAVRHQQRWTVASADAAVRDTVAAARYLATQRDLLAPRTLVLACQGVDAVQYRECVVEVLRVATPADWIGLGGWCILGRCRRRWLPAFWETLHTCLPLIARAGVRHVHVFGVLWPPALGGLVWLADQHGLVVSTDSSAPLLAATWPDPRKAGLRVAGYVNNVVWWRHALDRLRRSCLYCRPPRPARQLALAL
jgi:hypothetical protein